MRQWRRALHAFDDKGGEKNDGDEVLTFDKVYDTADAKIESELASVDAGMSNFLSMWFLLIRS